MTREDGQERGGQTGRRARKPRRCAWCRVSLGDFRGQPEVHAGRAYHPDCLRYGAQFDRRFVGWETDADQVAQAERRRARR